MLVTGLLTKEPLERSQKHEKAFLFGLLRCARDGDRLRHHQPWGYYDVQRAKYICAKFGLSFNDGPYIAFFEERPDLPVGPNTKSEFDGGFERTSKPALVLSLAGMDLNDALSTINELEFDLLRGDVRILRLSANQLRRRLSRACKNAASKVGRAAKILRDVRDLTTPTSSNETRSHS